MLEEKKYSALKSQGSEEKKTSIILDTLIFLMPVTVYRIERKSWKSDSSNLGIVFLRFCTCAYCHFVYFCTVIPRITQFDTFAVI